MDQPLPDYQDHVTGHNLCAPASSQQESAETVKRISHYVSPDNPSFGPPSTVKVPRFQIEEAPADNGEVPLEGHVDDEPLAGRVRRSGKRDEESTKSVKRRPVKDRWYYEQVEDSGERAYLSKSTMESEGKEDSKINELVVDEPHQEISSVLGELGELDIISKTVVDLITPDETGACALQGVLFQDDELSWCRITGWGIESGTIIVFYLPVNAKDAVMKEFTSIDEMLLLVK